MLMRLPHHLGANGGPNEDESRVGHSLITNDSILFSRGCDWGLVSIYFSPLAGAGTSQSHRTEVGRASPGLPISGCIGPGCVQLLPGRVWYGTGLGTDRRLLFQ